MIILPPVTLLHVSGVLHRRAAGPRRQVYAGSTIYTTTLYYSDCMTSVSRLRIRCTSRVPTASNFFITALCHMISPLPGSTPPIESHILNIRIQVVTSGLRQRSFRLLLSGNAALGFCSVTRLPAVTQLPLR